MKTIQTYLPVFDGFYGSHYQTDVQLQEENEYNYLYEEYGIDGFEIDFKYKEYYNELAQNICRCVTDKLIELELVSDSTFQKLFSPSYYNFSNDSIHVEFLVTEENIANIKAYLVDNLKAFEVYLKANYTSCSGFISGHSNDVNDWLNDNMFGTHKFGSILNFILTQSDYDSEALYYEVNYSYPIYLEPTKDYDEIVKEFKLLNE